MTPWSVSDSCSRVPSSGAGRHFLASGGMEEEGEEEEEEDVEGTGCEEEEEEENEAEPATLSLSLLSLLPLLLPLPLRPSPGSIGPSSPPALLPNAGVPGVLGLNPMGGPPALAGARAGVLASGVAPLISAAASSSEGTCTTLLAPGCQATIAIRRWMRATSGTTPAASSPGLRYSNSTWVVFSEKGCVE